VAFCSEESLRYVGREAMEWSTCNPLVTSLTWRAEHLSDDRPFDAYLVAPATYNTIGKFAQGIADSLIPSALASALGRLQQGKTRILIAPTMHGTMHNDILIRNVETLRNLGVDFITPRDEYGKHNLPDEGQIVASVCRSLANSPLKGRKILVTGGPTPVPIDGVRRIVNRFKGKLAAEIAEELILRGVDPTLILGDGADLPKAWIPHRIASTFDDYKRLVLESMEEGVEAGIFSAGVADYRPAAIAGGKIPSGQAGLNLELVPTEKIIELARHKRPDLYIVSFKYQEQVSIDQLLQIARERLVRYPVVIANRGEETQGHQQRAWIVTKDNAMEVDGKAAIASAICDHLETALDKSKS
jgi:phosphopantothenoylcysteine decarboxylase/phosphopantothenate--cysteine ligase